MKGGGWVGEGLDVLWIKYFIWDSFIVPDNVELNRCSPIFSGDMIWYILNFRGKSMVNFNDFQLINFCSCYSALHFPFHSHLKKFIWEGRISNSRAKSITRKKKNWNFIEFHENTNACENARNTWKKNLKKNLILKLKTIFRLFLKKKKLLGNHWVQKEQRLFLLVNLNKINYIQYLKHFSGI